MFRQVWLACAEKSNCIFFGKQIQQHSLMTALLSATSDEKSEPLRSGLGGREGATVLRLEGLAKLHATKPLIAVKALKISPD